MKTMTMVVPLIITMMVVGLVFAVGGGDGEGGCSQWGWL